MTLIEWNPALEIGIPEIDYQHRQLVSMINALRAAIDEGNENSALEEVLDALELYVFQHFAAEERLMESQHYAFIDEHKAEHFRLTEAVRKQRADFESGLCTAASLQEFLHGWLLNHIAGPDKYLAETLNKG